MPRSTVVRKHQPGAQPIPWLQLLLAAVLVLAVLALVFAESSARV